MGFWSKLVNGRSAPVQVDPMIDVVNRMLDREADRQKDQNAFMARILDQQQAQNEMMRQLVGQYVNTETNQTTSLDQRMFEKEQNFDWIPLDVDPFKGLGDSE